MKRGFTLVELSIVLMIIGLLIGGILVARSMADTARIQSQIRQFQQLETAANNYITTYKYLPGDNPMMKPAYYIETPTHNGNGMLDVRDSDGIHPCEDGKNEECAAFFDNLVASGQLPATALDFTADSSTGDALTYKFNHSVGNKYPKSKLSNGGVFIGQSVNLRNLCWELSSVDSMSNIHGAIYFPLSVSQAAAIDAKMDDGNPITGDIISGYGYMGSWGNP